MKQVQLRIRSNAEIADNVFRMEMEGDVSAITKAGFSDARSQYVMWIRS